MDYLLSRPYELDFDSTNHTATWIKWKQTMQLNFNAVMGQKTEEESILWHFCYWSLGINKRRVQLYEACQNNFDYYSKISKQSI